MQHKIKTYEDACAALNRDPDVLPDVSMFQARNQQWLVDMYKLSVIAEALNEGWVADFSDPDEFKYYPWFYMGSSGSASGFRFGDFACDYSYSGVGARLSSNSREDCNFIAKEYPDLWQIFILN